MNKLIAPLAFISVLGLFNAYSTFAQSQSKNDSETQKQSAQDNKRCNTAAKEFCCKTEKPKEGNCCACCTGAHCAAGGKGCCG